MVAHIEKVSQPNNVHALNKYDIKPLNPPDRYASFPTLPHSMIDRVLDADPQIPEVQRPLNATQQTLLEQLKKFASAFSKDFRQEYLAVTAKFQKNILKDFFEPTVEQYLSNPNFFLPVLDIQAGSQALRTLQRFSRMKQDGLKRTTIKDGNFLLIFDYPPEMSKSYDLGVHSAGLDCVSGRYFYRRLSRGVENRFFHHNDTRTVVLDRLNHCKEHKAGKFYYVFEVKPIKGTTRRENIQDQKHHPLEIPLEWGVMVPAYATTTTRQTTV